MTSAADMNPVSPAALAPIRAGQTAQAAAKAWNVPARYVGYEANPASIVGGMEWTYRQLP